MKVYVLEVGEYSDRWLHSVHATLVDAKNVYPAAVWEEADPSFNEEHQRWWGTLKDGSYGEDSLTIHEMELHPVEVIAATA